MEEGLVKLLLLHHEHYVVAYDNILTYCHVIHLASKYPSTHYGYNPMMYDAIWRNMTRYIRDGVTTWASGLWKL